MVSTLPSEKRRRRTSGSGPPVVKTKYFRSGERFQFTKLPSTRSVHFWVLRSKVLNFVPDWLAATIMSCVTQKGPCIPCESGNAELFPVRKSIICSVVLLPTPKGSSAKEVHASDLPSGDQVP